MAINLPSGKEINTSDVLINTLFLGLILPTILSSIFDAAVRVKTNNGYIWVNLNNSNYKKFALTAILISLTLCVIINLLAVSRLTTVKFPLMRSISLLFLIYTVINYLYMPYNWYSYQVLAVCVFWIYGSVSPFSAMSYKGELLLKVLVMSSLLFSVFFSLIFPERSTFSCRSDKCGILGNLWMGFFPHENALGFFAVVTCGLSFMYNQTVARLTVQYVSVFLVLASGSRLALISLSCLFLFKWLNKTILTLIPIAVVLLSVSLLFTTGSSERLTGRGGIWMKIKSNLDESGWFFGQGMRGFQTGESKSVFGFTLVDEQNSVISIVSRYGILGVLLFSLFLSVFFMYRMVIEKRMLILLAVFGVAMISESFAVPTLLNFYTLIYFLCLTRSENDATKSNYEVSGTRFLR
jgi:hypothetical protein